MNDKKIDLSQIEIDMLEKGYASSRMVASKIKRDLSTVHRLVREGHFDFAKVGDQRFIDIESVRLWAGPDGVRLLELDTWSF